NVPTHPSTTLSHLSLHDALPIFLMDPHEVAGAFCVLKDAGKVREFGVSNFKPSQLEALQKACPLPLIVNQVEISLANLHCFEDRSEEHTSELQSRVDLVCSLLLE